MSAPPPIFTRGRTRRIAVLVGLAWVEAGAAAVVAAATRSVFDHVGGSGAGLPWLALAGLVAAGALTAGLRVAERGIGEHIGQTYAADLRRRLFAHIARLPARTLAHRRSGYLAIRYIGDLRVFKVWVSEGVARLISAGCMLPVMLGLLAVMSVPLALAAAGPLLVAVIVMALASPALIAPNREVRQERGRIAADMNERMPVAPELRLMGRLNADLRRLNGRMRALRTAAVRRAVAIETIRAIPELIGGAAVACVLGTAIVTDAPVGTAVGVMTALGLATTPLRDLALVCDRYRAWSVAHQKVHKWLTLPALPDPAESDAPTPEPAAQPAALAFEDVEVPGALDELTASASAGDRVAVVGPNGAGKSTLLDLAARLDDPASGHVRLDGADLRHVPPSRRAREIALVRAATPILKGSLRAALAAACAERPDDDAIEAVAHAHGLAGVLDRLGGLDGKLAEGGRNLSAGERRRVLLARAALAQPRLLLLDEADDALDPAGRSALRTLLRTTPATVLMVTHDRDAALAADTVWFVRDGRVVEHGAPRALLEAGGPAAAMLGGPPAAAA
ncbi:ATP-binding cassette, subfamily B/ATP-binding cassette, subfamily C, CydC [Limimonas halophila]|uniref:ATP-binding cassette, subfamily B/ATP-binding cassette, subfamily C, CydC n=1 Tax=Limimonas halophila TaxID=1082479 RepID=A0A1G7NZY7_9PROT|nr:ABC transporter ATP-binding protein [Limimonas halophila]SDF78750.1 ATP-binding cassette, subfamily B/ATP-binding cassette, subfamily C, CydC [Limimonas halophila]